MEREITECRRKGATIVFSDGTKERLEVLGHIGCGEICMVCDDWTIALETGGPMPV